MVTTKWIFPKHIEEKRKADSCKMMIFPFFMKMVFSSLATAWISFWSNYRYDMFLKFIFFCNLISKLLYIRRYYYRLLLNYSYYFRLLIIIIDLENYYRRFYRCFYVIYSWNLQIFDVDTHIFFCKQNMDNFI